MKKHISNTSTSHSKKFQSLMVSSYQPDNHKLSRSQTSQSTQHHLLWKKIIILVSLITLGTLIVIILWSAHNFSKASQKLFGTDNVWDVFRTTELKNTLDGRTNVLLVGYSADDPGHTGATLTDSILILSLDNTNRTGYVLSVPRDLYIDVPGYGTAKINEAYQAGEYMKFHEPKKPLGGIGLLQKIINDNLGIDIHYHALINYSSVKEVVDALEGIDVTIKSNDQHGIYDPNFPMSQGGPLKLSNGKHIIDGQTALRFTRARGATYDSYGFPQSDFNRTQNQQQVLTSIKEKLNWKLVLDPRTNKKIFEAVGDNIKTNLTINEVIPFYRLLTSIPNSNLRPITLNNIDGDNLLTDYTTPTAQSALIPAAGIDDYSAIQAVIEKLPKS